MGDRAGLTRLDRTNGYDDGRDYMKTKKSKLAQQNEEIRDALRHRNTTMRTDLFKGISINVNGRTQPTADELKRMILLNGGDYHPYYRYQTTKFMIATNLSMARIKTLRPDDIIVRPEWITDSIKAKCVLPYQDYQLFDKSSNRDLNLQLTDGNSNNSSDVPSRVSSSTSRTIQPTANASTTTSSINSRSNVDRSKRNVQDRKQQTTLESFVIRGATRPKADETKPEKSLTAKAATSSRTGNIKSCLLQQQHKCKNVANICGLTAIDDIIGLINEWVGCPEGINDADTACVTKYFYDLMNEKNYHDKFYEVLYALQQRVIQHDDKNWIDLFNSLVETLKEELSNNGEDSQNLCQLISMIETTTAEPEHRRTSKVDPDNSIPVINIDDDDDDEATIEYHHDNNKNVESKPSANTQ